MQLPVEPAHLVQHSAAVLLVLPQPDQATALLPDWVLRHCHQLGDTAAVGDAGRGQRLTERLAEIHSEEADLAAELGAELKSESEAAWQRLQQQMTDSTHLKLVTHNLVVPLCTDAQLVTVYGAFPKHPSSVHTCM